MPFLTSTSQFLALKSEKEIVMVKKVAESQYIYLSN